MKFLKIMLCIFLTLILTGCSGREIEVSENNQQLTYEYEIVSAEIQELDMRHWFAITHRYEWHIEVYYEPYDLHYEENSWSKGAFGAPIFYNSKIGDNISVEIRNTYKNGEIIERKIIRIR